jgi:hypothetical protein
MDQAEYLTLVKRYTSRLSPARQQAWGVLFALLAASGLVPEESAKTAAQMAASASEADIAELTAG